ncbi:hypothetical protein G6F24_017143 [Rhizopus arrhizus]|nr:hypothetical protein G6F24_017143 [Rhizopus arrhizus]
MPGPPQRLAQSPVQRSCLDCPSGRTPSRPQRHRLPCAEHPPGRGLAAHRPVSPAAVTSRWPGRGRPAAVAPAPAPSPAAWNSRKAGRPALRTSRRDPRCTARFARPRRADAAATTRSWPQARRPTGRR